MYSMGRLCGCVFIIAISVMLTVGRARADVDITKYPLGMSPKTLHDKLVADQFVFQKFKADEIFAMKRVALQASPGSEYPDTTQSTTLKAKICAGKVFRIQMTSVYNADRNGLLMGRKSFYKYLKDNDAINDSLSFHKVETNPRVVLSFSIDRNSQKNKDVRGTEVAKLALGTSNTIFTKLANGHKLFLLEMSYFLENKWFCPN